MLRVHERIRLALAASVAPLLVAAPAAAAPNVVGKVTGKLPASSRAATVVRAFDAGQARLAATSAVSRTGAFKLTLPPGGYVLETTVTPARGRTRDGVHRITPLTIAAGQKRGAVRIARPTARTAVAAGPRAHAAYSQESGGINPGRLAFTIERFSGATGELAVMNAGLTDLLLTDALNVPGCRRSVIANSHDRTMLVRELEFQQSRYVDPSTRVVRNFIEPDIVVTGRLRTRGSSLGYVLTLKDARTGAVLETVSGTLAGGRIFDQEETLAKRLVKRLCAYGEVFEVTFTGDGRANFATHTATGTLAATPIVAVPTEADEEGAATWEGGAAIAWSNVAVVSKSECSYRDFISGGRWTTKLERAGEGMAVTWLADAGSSGTATVACPTDEGEVTVPGQPTTALVGSEPGTFLLPRDGKQAVTGGLQDQGDGWDNTLEMKVRTIRVQRIG